MTDQLREQVRDHYARAARATLDVLDTAPAQRGPDCCGEPIGDPVFGPGLYTPEQIAAVPDAAALASLGCGNPTAVAELRPGEVVLDLGSGGGIDVLLAAGRVGPTGTAYGLDMTDEMLELARRNAAAAGVGNAVFLKGEIEAIPLPDASVDVVISNCVVNLSGDKQRVFGEIARILRPGGRIGISDIVADDALSAPDRAARGDHVGCIAGALSFGEYADGLAAAGLEGIALTPTHAVVDGMFGTIVAARKPGVDEARQPDVAAGPRRSPALSAAVEKARHAGRALPAAGTVTLGRVGDADDAGCCS